MFIDQGQPHYGNVGRSALSSLSWMRGPSQTLIHRPATRSWSPFAGLECSHEPCDYADQHLPFIVSIVVCEIADHAAALHVGWAGVIIFKINAQVRAADFDLNQV